MSNDFIKDTEQWRKRREDALKDDFGWLSLSDLFWLKQGTQTIGTDQESDLVLNSVAYRPGRIGILELEGETLRFTPAKGIEAFIRGKTETHVDGTIELKFDSDEDPNPTLVRVGDLQITAIKRKDIQNGLRYGIRMRDRASPQRAAFKGLKWYAPDPDYRVSAEFEAYSGARIIPIKNIFGNDVELVSIGRLHFSLKGTDYTLESAEEEGHLFVNFRDKSSGKTTYGSGRFLHPKMPENGLVTLDFNRAFSPPCAFTPLAICPLPTKANHLPIAIEAGELYEAGHDGAGH